MAIDLSYFDQVDAQVALISNRIDAVLAKATGAVTAEEAALKRDLQAVVDRTFPHLSAQYADAQLLIAKLEPALALLALNPTDLPSLLSFVAKLTEYVLGPQLAPVLAAEAQLVALVARVTTLVANLENVASKLEGFTLTVPSFP